MTLTTTVIILSSLIAYGAAYIEYSAICNNETFTMRISGNILTRKFITSGSIRCINITSGNIRYMENGAFDGVPNLTYLNLEGNYISLSNLFSFGSIANLKALILSNQRENYYDLVVPINLTYPELRYLNLRNNEIISITNYDENSFPKLKHLDISYNRFSSFTFTGTWANTLKYLQLDNNEISDISLSTLKNLETLAMNNNNIRNIAYDFHRENNLDLTGLNNLKHLSVANNSITWIDKLVFNETVKLRYLDLSYNQLSSTVLDSETFALLTSLKVLVLNGNELETIPFTTPLNITALWLNCNNLANLTASSFSNVPYLKTLSLARNKISRIDTDVFYSLRMLEKLYLNDNDLSYLPHLERERTRDLRYLDLSRNKFTTLDDVFDSNYVRLQKLHLGGNPLENIKKDSLAMLPKDLTIYLNFGGNNPDNVCIYSNHNHWLIEYD
ncbi:lumican-like isoform X1 [Megachile rotundata]|uniref:lumican-like isoform X1 n=1 Tax=Megachile rotundata TaxID=143995 RepID=UPI003FD3B7D5